MVRWAFDTLEIDITKDKRQIKKAYSRLVKRYHPEEYPEEWSRIHEAYETAIRYAEGMLPEEPEQYGSESRTEEKPETYEERNRERENEYENIGSEESYDELFRQAQGQWTAEKSEKTKDLALRLKELVQVPGDTAYEEWQSFFQSEFLLNAELDEMVMLYEALHGNVIPPGAAKLIVGIMGKRKEFYQYAMEFEKVSLADGIINCALQSVYAVRQKPKKTKTLLKLIALGAAAAVILFVITSINDAKDSVNKTRIGEEAVKYLNDKYGGDAYTEEEIKVDSVVLFGESSEELSAYRVIEQEGYQTIACIVEEKENMVCFDNIQEAEIRQAFQKRLNERTGEPEGRLFWNSAGGDFDCIGDGFFHEKYSGNIDEFLHSETKARDLVSGRDYSNDNNIFMGKNGVVDYYIPDKEAETVEQRLKLSECPENTEVKEALEQCASEYEMQLRGIVLPQNLFEEQMKKTEWGDSRQYVVQAFSSPYEIHPPLPFLLTTGWYVNVPPHGEEYLKIKSGFYEENPVQMADGILGSKSGIVNYLDITEMENDLTGCMATAETPDSLKLTEEQRRKSISFSLAKGYTMYQDYCLAIEKAAYGIPDYGYHVVLTEYPEYSEEEEKTTEKVIYTYSDSAGNVNYGDALDGEGYLFVEYPEAENDEKPAVLTIYP